MRCIVQMKLLKCVKTQTEPFIGSPDQHRLQEWVRPQPGAAAAARPALPSLHRRIGQRCNEVINPPACIPPTPFTTLPLPHCGKLLVDAVSKHLHGTVSETISSKNPKKSGRKNFTLAGDPNTKSPPLPSRRQFASTDGRRLGLQREEARRRSLAHCHCHSVCLSAMPRQAHWGSQVYVTHLDTWGRWLPMGSASPSAPLTDKMTLTDWLTQSVDGPWHAGDPVSRLCPHFILCSSSSAVLGRNELRVRSFQNVIEK